MYCSLYCKGSKRLLKVCVWDGAGDRTELKYFDPHSYGRQRCVFLVLLILNRRPWGPLCWVLAFFTASYQHLLWNPNTIGFPRAPSAGCGFPYHISSNYVSNSTATGSLLSWLSYIVVQRPIDRPLDLWNRMFNRHQAEITVMQFTSHSLPVHQSMSVSWALPCPISSAKSTHVISFDYWPLECVTSFRCITLEWHFWPGQRPKYNMCTFLPYHFAQTEYDIRLI